MGGVATLSKGGAVEDMSTTLSEKEDLSRIRGIEVIVSTDTFGISPKVTHHILT